MIALALLATSAASGAKPAPWPRGDEPSVDVWLLAGAEAREVWTGGGDCAPSDAPGRPLPQGLRGAAELLAPDACGEDWLIVRFDDDGIGGGYAYVRSVQVSRDAPAKNVWEAKPALREIRLGVSSKPLWTIPLDDPKWTHPHPIAWGEAVAVLDEEQHVVRDANGRELVVPTFAWPSASWQIKPEDVKDLRARVVAGKRRAEAAGDVAPLPPAKDLLSGAADGRVFWFEFDPKELTADRRFAADWLDPTGQALEGACEKPYRSGPSRPCGRYWLDYSAFGAWWPTSTTDVFAVADGTIERASGTLPVLRVVVKQPYTDRAAVSPAWDGVDPGALQSPP